MKKRVLSMLMVMIMMVSMLSVSVFAANHTDASGCTEAETWSFDASSHWKACSNSECTLGTKLDEAAHADIATVDGKCDTCEYVMHKHIWSAEDFGYNSTHHWNKCAGEGTCFVTANEKMYGYAEHSLVVDTSNTDPTKTVKKCVCGYTVEEHAHVWATTLSYDDNNHWYECTAAGCESPVATKDKVAHTWVKDEANSTATNIVYKCECGKTKGEHVHVYSTSVSSNADYHWYACECGDKKAYEMHYDHNADYDCDVCDTHIPVGTVTSLTVTGASEPSEGLAVDFTVSAEEPRFGTPVVKWNRVVDLSKDTSVALGEGSKFAAGTMYNTSILVPMNSQDKVGDNFTVTLNGITVPYYTTDAAYKSALKSFEGNYPVYAAKLMWTNDFLCVCISVQYPTTPGTHVHDFGNDYYETPAKHHEKCVACGFVQNAEYHYDNNKSGLCDVCGYNMNYYNPNAPTYPEGTSAGTSGSGTHTHTYSSDWVEDISNHWKQCTGCGAKTQTAAHADLNNTNKCDVCGFVMKAEAGHTHAFATEWTETFAQHYKVCSCGAKNEIAAHVDLNNTGKCDTCGYAMTTLSNNGIVADTGDDNATFLWMAAFAVSVLGVGATVMFARKKREE